MKSIKQTYLALLFSFLFSFTACVNEPKRDATNDNQLGDSTSSSTTEGSKEKIARIQKIFYTLPSPLELTYLFKKEGVDYQRDKLHDIAKRSNYNLKVKKALNLGIYGADLSYAGLFGKHQDAIEYFTVTQNMAEELGIGQTFQKEFISRLEQNANNKDTLLQVVSEFFLDNDSYLKNQNQQDVSTFILAGGWIEGLYLGTEMANKDSDADGIREIIASQRFSLDNLVVLLNNLNDKEGASDLIVAVKKIDEAFNTIKASDSTSKTSAKTEDGVLKISSESENVILPDSSFVKIKKEVAAIRAKIIE